MCLDFLKYVVCWFGVQDTLNADSGSYMAWVPKRLLPPRLLGVAAHMLRGTGTCTLVPGFWVAVGKP